MAGVTTFGKVLRKLRIDHSEILGDMAKRLGISPAYLSAIENNGRVIPDDLIEKLVQEYNLNDAQTKELEEAKAQTSGAVAIQFENLKENHDYIQTAVMFARDFSKLTSQQIIQLRNLLKEFEENPKEIWNSNIFGKSLHELVNEGLHNKLSRMPDESRLKLRETLQRIINEGSGGLICIIL